MAEIRQLPPDRILVRTVKAMSELRAYPTWQVSLEGAEPDRAPLFVQILEDAPQTAPQLSDYYIVTIRRRGGDVSPAGIASASAS